MWFAHGGEATINAYKTVKKEKVDAHIMFLKSLQNYYIDSKNRLFLHAGFTNLNGVAFEYFPKMFYWERTLWETACALDKSIKTTSPLYPKRLTLYHEIFIGHTPVTKIESAIPVQMANVWNVDTGAGFKGSLTVLDVDTKDFWQSSSLQLLYHEESGRN
jgi:serine/threonine protein phosphatase 1